MDERRKDFKKGVDHDESRRRRTETTVQLRKEKKDDQLSKRRQLLESSGNTIGTNSSSSGSSGGNVSGYLQQQQQQQQQQPIATDNRNISIQIEENLPLIYSNDPALMLKATILFRRLLSIEHKPPIQQVIDTGIVSRFVQFLQSYDNPTLQFEAAWALTNIASGTSEHTRCVTDNGAVPIFVQLLSSPNEDVREQAAWALGNVAGDSVTCRDLVLSLGGLQGLLLLSSHFTDNSRLSTIRNVTWTLSNLCRGKPQPPFDLVKGCLPLLARLLHSNDTEVITDACWALSYLSDGENERIQAVLEAGVSAKLVELLSHSAVSVQTPALRAVGNIVTGNDHQTQHIINLNCLTSLLWLLDHPKKNIKKESCWTISNITAGTQTQVQSVIDAGIVPKLIELLQVSDFDIKKEACWALSNATSGGTKEQIMYLAKAGAVPQLCQLLNITDPKIIAVALEGLENILKAASELGESYLNGVVSVFHECDGVTQIEELQNHENHGIYNRAVKILEVYFAGEDVSNTNTTTNIVPAVSSNSNTFSFGLPPQPPF